MFTLHCTAKLRERLGRPLAEAPRPPSTALGDWYATALFWRPQLALLVNERTLLPVLLPLAPAATLLHRIAPAVAEVLRLHGLDPDFVGREVAEMAEVAVAKTANRSVVGTMSEFTFEAEIYRDHRGMTDPLQLAMLLAETPCGAIGGNSPARLLWEVAAAASHRAECKCSTCRPLARELVCQAIRRPGDGALLSGRRRATAAALQPGARVRRAGLRGPSAEGQITARSQRP